MLSWQDFEKEAPQFAAAGRRLLVDDEGVAIGFLASVSADGVPHLAPVCPIFCGAALYLSASARSPKARDLRADGRYVLHAFLGAYDEEFQLAGRGEEVIDEAERAAVHEAILFPSFDRADPIFHLAIERSLWVHWERPGQKDTTAVRRRWPEPGS